MSRSGYYEVGDSDAEFLAAGRWRGQVASAIRGNRGQKFLKELAQAMDAMSEKELYTGALVTPEGECCAMGVVCQARGLDVDHIDEYNPQEVGELIGIASQLAAEIAHENDDGGYNETPQERWLRMREWVEENINQ